VHGQSSSAAHRDTRFGVAYTLRESAQTTRAHLWNKMVTGNEVVKYMFIIIIGIVPLPPICSSRELAEREWCGWGQPIRFGSKQVRHGDEPQWTSYSGSGSHHKNHSTLGLSFMCKGDMLGLVVCVMRFCARTGCSFAAKVRIAARSMTPPAATHIIIHAQRVGAASGCRALR
jgi:hypothetical protein